jgi:hypothetical protein
MPGRHKDASAAEVVDKLPPQPTAVRHEPLAVAVRDLRRGAN